MNPWILLIRPKTLWASLCPVAIAGIFIYRENFFSYKNIFIFLISLFCALSLQISSNIINDYFDGIKGTDKNRIGPTRVTQSQLLSLKQIKNTIIFALSLSTFLGAFLVFHGGIFFLILGILALFSCYFYTAGKKPLGYLGLGDILVFIFFGPVASYGTWYLCTQTHQLFPFLYSLVLGFLSVNILLCNNLRDAPQDTLCGKKTTIVRFGVHFGKTLYFLGIFSSFLIPLFHYMKEKNFIPLHLLTFFIAFPLFLKIKKAKKSEDYLSCLPQTSILLLIFTILTFLSFLIKI